MQLLSPALPSRHFCSLGFSTFLFLFSLPPHFETLLVEHLGNPGLFVFCFLFFDDDGDDDDNDNNKTTD